MDSIDALVAAVDAVAGASFARVNNPEVVATLAKLEVVQRRLTAVGHTLISQLVERGSPVELGGTSFADVLSHRLHISKSVARRRIADSEQLGPRRALTGEALAPQLPNVACAFRDGLIGDEHVRIIRGFFDHLPAVVDLETRDATEERLAVLAAQFSPGALRVCADRIMALINPDGEFSDVDRARRRQFTLGRQGMDGMSTVSGLLDPETRAYLEAVLSKWAAPGMCNPDDQNPAIDEPTESIPSRDTRTAGQRNHDALKMALRATLASGDVGSHHGLPVTVVVSATLTELGSAVGRAVTGGDTLLPISDLIRMAGHAHHYLHIFDDADERPLYLGRTKRIATADQRIVLHAKDRGCSAPGCTVPGYLCEVHHVDEWSGEDGPTNIDNLTFACGPHHRLIKPGGWTTRKSRRDGLTEWIPPPHLDIGQSRTNELHHPERLTVDTTDYSG